MRKVNKTRKPREQKVKKKKVEKVEKVHKFSFVGEVGIPRCRDCGRERVVLEDKESWNTLTLNLLDSQPEILERLDKVIYCKHCDLQSVLYKAEKI